MWVLYLLLLYIVKQCIYMYKLESLALFTVCNQSSVDVTERSWQDSYSLINILHRC